MNEKTEKAQVQHTPEPWEFAWRGEGTSWNDIFAEAGAIQIAKVPGVGEEGGIGEANSRRIVACVNACAGISTEGLKSGVVGELLKAAKAILATVTLENDRPVIHLDYRSPEALGLERAVARAEGK